MLPGEKAPRSPHVLSPGEWVLGALVLETSGGRATPTGEPWLMSFQPMNHLFRRKGLVFAVGLEASMAVAPSGLGGAPAKAPLRVRAEHVALPGLAGPAPSSGSPEGPRDRGTGSLHLRVESQPC